MKLTTKNMKHRIPISQLISDCVQWCRDTGNLRPSHCDVRCMINDALNSYEANGATVHHGYSQDRAFSAVRKQLEAA